MKSPAIPLLATAVAAGVALTLGLSVVGGAATSATSASVAAVAELTTPPCVVRGPVKGLTAAQAGNADALVAAAMAASAADLRAARIALMTAIAESDLENLDAVGGDLFGLFQEPPSPAWGTPAQLMDPTYATDKFVSRLLALHTWSSLQPWAAAADTQRPNNLDVSRYERAWAESGRVLSAVVANANQPGGCGQGVGSPAGSGHGLPPGYVIPPGTPPEHAVVVRFALAQLGKPYAWGGAGPNAYDCSGLTMAAWCRPIPGVNRRRA